MHMIVLDSTDPRAGAFLFSYTREYRAGNINQPAFWAPTLDWATPGFLKIEPQEMSPLPEGSNPPPPSIWIPVALVAAIYLLPKNQQMPTPASTKVH
ncbi:hypothetical protein D9M72_393360 [compost metagenome]